LSSLTKMRTKSTSVRSPTRYKRSPETGLSSALVSEKFYPEFILSLLLSQWISTCKWRCSSQIWSGWRRWLEVLRNHFVRHILAHT
jgi:hypothetical protein